MKLHSFILSVYGAPHYSPFLCFKAKSYFGNEGAEIIKRLVAKRFPNSEYEGASLEGYVSEELGVTLNAAAGWSHPKVCASRCDFVKWVLEQPDECVNVTPLNVYFTYDEAVAERVVDNGRFNA